MLEATDALRRGLPTLEGVSSSDEPERALPWRPEHGPKPTVRTWPPGDRPGLFIWANGRWRYASVTARHDYEDGRTAYQVLIDVDGSTSVRHRTYWWQPEAGRMKPSHPARSAQPGTGRPEGRGGMPRAPHRPLRPPSPSQALARRPPPA